ncbi:MAG: Xaa-Pro peptidase family protein [Gemmataceae bacterium]|nr:Xaa-Pro peptidase family protein [Gemmataceae bacterium]MCS7270030.1 Xaa-Pro peptidase family protein [Gemmataceae bacterium]MDW8243966.1 Xaa-Pro peptidase family protein [Thermogemmata sp.]
MNYVQQRRQTLTQNLKKHGVDAFLVSAVPNVTYLTNFTGDSSYYVATSRHNFIVSDTRYEEQIREECTELEVVIRGHDKTTLEAVAEVLNKSGAKNVAVEGNRITLEELEQLKGLAPRITFVPVYGEVEAMRMIKDPGEVEQIRAAIRIAERAYQMFIATLRETDTEKEMVDAMDGYIRRAGGRGPAFQPIVAVGERGALPHAPPTSKQLGEGSKLLVDWGVDLIYKCDLTRTIRSPFATVPMRKNKFERVGVNFEEVYNIVLSAQNAALAMIRPGVKVKEIDAAVRKVFDSAKLKKGPRDAKLSDFFTHGLGHGIGLEVHEAPRIRANSNDVLDSGMVISIEPALYIPGWGGVRIEDNVLVTHNGCTLLSTIARQLPSEEAPEEEPTE